MQIEKKNEAGALEQTRPSKRGAQAHGTHRRQPAMRLVSAL